jgi:hypothetical protein
MGASERDSFANLLLLCLGHHEEVDGDEDRYPPEQTFRDCTGVVISALV